MSDGSMNGHTNLPALFDVDHSSTIHHYAGDHWPLDGLHNHHTTAFSNHDIFSFDDPLKHAYKYQIKPIQLDTTHFHFTKPHYVKPTVTIHGDLREGTYRDGDGNPNIDNPFGGFWKANP
ncbi:hypothetical protein E5161_09415 [Cohnella pontilimi]|uniref:Uncharacterized protein n=1 Tax=Cohnella pontilimi TaxID=2564100 RepID=A0A4U0FC40_9BACL|nr:hypothetical protein [Cohnella pontilimi]TJY42218.1 hypothetical protein E5161_09415 [Cohnella pontilimi]